MKHRSKSAIVAYASFSIINAPNTDSSNSGACGGSLPISLAPTLGTAVVLLRLLLLVVAIFFQKIVCSSKTADFIVEYALFGLCDKLLHRLGLIETIQ